MSTVMQVEQVARGPGRILTVHPQQTIVDAVRTMNQCEIGCLLVVDEREKIVGILTERDIISSVVGPSLDPATTLVEAVMTRKVVACSRDTSLARAQQVMADHSIRHLPIIENGRALGMISSRDILAHQLATVQAVARQQSRMLHELEHEHPGISHIVKDGSGRVVI